jgi:predicted class III extradiol MEMO1 family dioxygenase
MKSLSIRKNHTFCVILLGMIVSVIISENNKLAIKKSKWVEHTRSVHKVNQLESLIQYALCSRAYIIVGFDFHKISRKWQAKR